jgi:hypothetical protein
MGATIPAVPVENAGTVSASADWNAWGSAASFLLKSASGSLPMFFLMSSTAQTWTTSGVPVNWSNTAAVFKDNDSGFSSGTPNRYTIQTAGYWTFTYAINGGTSSTNLATYFQVTTSAANPYNPSATVQFCFNDKKSFAAQGSNNCSGSLCPIYLFPADFVQVFAVTSATSTEGSSPFSQFTGQWVSM